MTHGRIAGTVPGKEQYLHCHGKVHVVARRKSRTLDRGVARFQLWQFPSYPWESRARRTTGMLSVNITRSWSSPVTVTSNKDAPGNAEQDGYTGLSIIEFRSGEGTRAQGRSGTADRSSTLVSSGNGIYITCIFSALQNRARAYEQVATDNDNM